MFWVGLFGGKRLFTSSPARQVALGGWESRSEITLSLKCVGLSQDATISTVSTLTVDLFLALRGVPLSHSNTL